MRLSTCGSAAGPHGPSPASFEPLSGSATFDASSASPTGWHTHSGCCAKVSDDGLKNVGLIHRPSFIGAIAWRTAPKCASGNRGLNFDSARPVPARLRILRRVRHPVARARLPPVVEDERLDAHPLRDRRDLLHRREVHVVLGAGRDPVRVHAVGVERHAVLVGQHPVVDQVLVELPRLVRLVQPEADEHRGQLERLARPHDPHARLAVERVLDVRLLLERSQAQHVAREVDHGAAGSARRKPSATRAGRCAP